MRRGDLRLVHATGATGPGQKASESDSWGVPVEGLGRRLQAGWQWLCAALWPTRGKAQRKRVQLLEVMPLGARRELMLVSCEGERFLIGAGPDSITTMMRVRPEQSRQDKAEMPQGPVSPWG